MAINNVLACKHDIECPPGSSCRGGGCVRWNETLVTKVKFQAQGGGSVVRLIGESHRDPLETNTIDNTCRATKYITKNEEECTATCEVICVSAGLPHSSHKYEETRHECDCTCCVTVTRALGQTETIIDDGVGSETQPAQCGNLCTSQWSCHKNCFCLAPPLGDPYGRCVRKRTAV